MKFVGKYNDYSSNLSYDSSADLKQNGAKFNKFSQPKEYIKSRFKIDKRE